MEFEERAIKVGYSVIQRQDGGYACLSRSQEVLKTMAEIEGGEKRR